MLVREGPSVGCVEQEEVERYITENAAPIIVN